MLNSVTRNNDVPASSQADFMKHGSTVSTPENQCVYGFNYNEVNKCLSSAFHYSLVVFRITEIKTLLECFWNNPFEKNY